jgi:hypothetical protein
MMLQAARPDAVDAVFVIAHLLKRQAQSVCEHFLGHALHLTSHSHTIADVPVGCMR